MRIAVLLSLLTFAFLAEAQKNQLSEVKYRRSSLHRLVVEGVNFPESDLIMNASKFAPFPDKYNDHTLEGYDIIELDSATAAQVAADSSNLKVNGEDVGLMQIGKLFKSKVQGKKTDALVQERIDAYLEENKIARKLVAKWFQRDPSTGVFKMDLIGERGFYNATEMEAQIAAGSARGTASLADAGEELIRNTFLVVTTMDFIDNEPLALATRDVANAIIDQFGDGPAKTVAQGAVEVGYNIMKEGYTVFTKAYLYRLNWNDSVAAVFYNDLWVNPSSPDPSRKLAFEETDLFSLDFVGSSSANNIVTAIGGLSVGKEEVDSTAVAAEITGEIPDSDLSFDQLLLKKATIRNIDKVFAKLQKDYESFQIKVPLTSVEPLAAKIGMKEGLEGGERFAVLEQYIDENGITQYKSKAVIKVDKKTIWDNRFTASGEETIAGPYDYTEFKGKAKGLYPGMLIRQIK
ncbi:MAG: hypothetical protein AAF789_09295 [Bacteroidota bacterium]